VVFVLRDATPPHDVFLRRGQKDIVFQGTKALHGQVQKTLGRTHSSILCAEACCHLRPCGACACLCACRWSSARLSNISREFRIQSLARVLASVWCAWGLGRVSASAWSPNLTYHTVRAGWHWWRCDHCARRLGNAGKLSGSFGVRMDCIDCCL